MYPAVRALFSQFSRWIFDGPSAWTSNSSLAPPEHAITRTHLPTHKHHRTAHTYTYPKCLACLAVVHWLDLNGYSNLPHHQLCSGWRRRRPWLRSNQFRIVQGDTDKGGNEIDLSIMQFYSRIPVKQFRAIFILNLERTPIDCYILAAVGIAISKFLAQNKTLKYRQKLVY